MFAVLEASRMCRLFAVKDSSHIGDAHAYEYSNAVGLRGVEGKEPQIGLERRNYSSPKTE